MPDNKQENIAFKPKARLILHIGDKLIKNEKIAISEIIKNSYDACARNVWVKMTDIDSKNLGRIEIQDDGNGMDFDIIKNIWMQPGTDSKTKEDVKKAISECGRLPLGEKGIGRFGIHKLGNQISLISKKQNFKEVELSIDWTQFDSNEYLANKEILVSEKTFGNDTFYEENETGTFIEITGLRKIWTKREFRDFYRNIMSLVSPFDSKDDFNIHVETNLGWEKDLVTIDKVKKHALWYFSVTTQSVLDKESSRVYCKIKDFLFEFRPPKYMDKIRERKVTANDTFIKNDLFIKTIQEKLVSLIESKGFGDFSIEGYIFDLDKNTLDLSDIDDRLGFRNYIRGNGGVRVYKDGMRVYDYGEQDNDWLLLDRARINAPTKKIGNRLILGAVSLSRKDSFGLEEKTNREGFIENETFLNFVNAINFILDKINFQRNLDKDKIRNVYLKEVDNEESTITTIRKIEKKVQSENVVSSEKDKNDILNNLKKIERNYNEMKDTLLKSAGAGLAYGLIIHEIEKMISEIKRRVDKTDLSTLKFLVSSLESMIYEISELFQNNKFEVHDITNIIKKSNKFFKYRVQIHNIELVKNYIGKSFKISCSENFVINAIMNLIDNSIHWLKYHEKNLITEGKNRKILIDVKEFGDEIGIIVADTGFDFSISAETAILPFKSTKSAGTGIGLGLYFVNEIMKLHDGKLRIITNNQAKLDIGLDSEFNGAVVILQFKRG